MRNRFGCPELLRYLFSNAICDCTTLLLAVSIIGCHVVRVGEGLQHRSRHPVHLLIGNDDIDRVTRQ
jgi:hypothetical protein